MKKPFVFVFLLSFSLVFVSVIGSLVFYNDSDDVKVKSKITKTITKDITYEKINKDSPTINVYKADENKVEKMDIEEYLYGVLSSEMPSSFDRSEERRVGKEC